MYIINGGRRLKGESCIRKLTSTRSTSPKPPGREREGWDQDPGLLYENPSRFLISSNLQKRGLGRKDRVFKQSQTHSPTVRLGVVIYTEVNCRRK